MLQRIRSDGNKSRENNEIAKRRNKHFGYVMEVMNLR